MEGMIAGVEWGLGENIVSPNKRICRIPNSSLRGPVDQPEREVNLQKRSTAPPPKYELGSIFLLCNLAEALTDATVDGCGAEHLGSS